MLKINQVNNFLLLKYQRSDLKSPTPLSEKDKSVYLNCQDVLFRRTIEQIQFFHPKAHIHVLTNENMQSTASVSYYVYEEKWDNLLCKFKLYGLLNEPAMFIDLDIIFNRPIYPVECNSPICFFNTSWGAPLQDFSNKKLPCKQDVIYNSGVVWIPTPSSHITDELMELHEEYFSDEKAIYAKNLWPNNDEHALSLFVGIHNYDMPLNNTINVSRNKLEKLKIDVNPLSVQKYQSVHYNGVLTKQKMIDEYIFFKMSQHHNDESVKKYFKLGKFA
jgi:hypothetical protein